MKYLLLIIIFICSLTSVQAEKYDLFDLSLENPTPKKLKAYSFGLTLRSNGYGFFAQSMKHSEKSPLSKGISFFALTHKHNKEIRRTNPNVPRSSGYVFGKQFKAGILQGNFSLEYEFFSSKNRGIGLSLGSSNGLGLTILKPVYLEIAKINVSDNNVYYVQEKYDPDIHQGTENITGYARERRAWSELNYRLNLNSKLYVNLSWNNSGFTEKGFQLGLAYDYFHNSLPIMALIENPIHYATGYLSFFWRLQTK